MPGLQLWDSDLEPITGRRAGTCVTMSQFRQWLATVDLAPLPAVAGNIPASPYDPVNIAWNGPFVVLGDVLTVWTASQLGLAWPQMEAAWTTIAAYRITP